MRLAILAAILTLTACTSYQPLDTTRHIKDPLIRQAVEGCRALAAFHNQPDTDCARSTITQAIRQYEATYREGYKSGSALGRCSRWTNAR